jgi:hypothetical protein
MPERGLAAVSGVSGPQSAEWCGWCGEPASERVVVERATASRPARSAWACMSCSRRLVPPPPEPEQVVEERTPPLCQSCYAEITFVHVVKDGRRNGRRLPVDREPTHRPELRASMVVVNPRRGTGVVLTKALLEDAKGWLRAGATLHLPHFASCSRRAR